MALLNGLGLLNSLQIGRRAVSSNQTALEVTGKNIANVNTPGYTRQRVIPGVNDRRADVIAGDRMPQIQTLRDALTERLLLQEQGRFGSLTRQAELMAGLESLLNEPSDSGLDAALGRFFAAAEAVAATPESRGVRRQLIERARVVASTLRNLATQIAVTQEQNVADARTIVDQVNQKLEAIYALNVEIQRTTEPSARFELQSHQEQIVRELAEQLAVRMEEQEDGTRRVTLNGLTLVSGTEAARLRVDAEANGGLRFRASIGGRSFEVVPTGGSLEGFMRFQNEHLPAIEADLHLLARQLIAQVNAIHPNFFRELTDPAQLARAARYIEVVAEDVRTSSTGQPGGNDLVLRLADLQNQSFSELDGMTIPGFYRELVTAIGAQSAELEQQRQTSELIHQQLQQRREAVSGVSLDEEGANLVAFQRGFQAAARYVQVVDQLLETIVERL